MRANRTTALLSVVCACACFLPGCTADKEGARALDAEPTRPYHISTGGLTEMAVPPAPSTRPDTYTELVLQLHRAAADGKVINWKYAVDRTTLSDIIRDWGEPEQKEAIGQERLLSYPSRHAAFLVSPDDRVREIHSFEPSLNDLTHAKVTSALQSLTGTPADGAGQQEIAYPAGAYRLRFVFKGGDENTPLQRVIVSR